MKEIYEDISFDGQKFMRIVVIYWEKFIRIYHLWEKFMRIYHLWEKFIRIYHLVGEIYEDYIHSMGEIYTGYIIYGRK